MGYYNGTKSIEYLTEGYRLMKIWKELRKKELEGKCTTKKSYKMKY